MSIEIVLEKDSKRGHIILNGIKTLVTPEQAHYLYDVSKRLGPGTYVELGSFLGGTAVCIAKGIKDNNIDAKLIAVDLFDGAKPYTGYKEETNIENVKARFVTNNVDDIITTIKGDSARAANNFIGQQVNFVFIDGDHSWSGCKADVDAWTPLVKPGGEVAFHDSELKGPFKCIRYLIQSGWEQLYTFPSMVVLRKPEGLVL